MKSARLVPAAIAAVALLGACSPMPSTAAVVEGTRISEADVERTVVGCAAAVNVEPAQVKRGVIAQILTMGEVSKYLLADAGVEEAMVDQIAAQDDSSKQMLANVDCAPLVRAQGWQTLLSQAAGADILDQIAAVDVQLNPRYGTWAPSSQSLFLESGSMSVLGGDTQQ